MANFGSIGYNIGKLNIEKIMFSFFSEKKIQDSIINTLQDRLFAVGLKKGSQSIDTDKGNPYAPYTQAYKRSKGEPFNRVTLADSGSLYDSMVLQVQKNQMSLVASFDNPKYDGGIFKNFQSSFANKKEFEETVMSLTENEIEKIIDNLTIEIKEEIKKNI